MTLPAIDQPVLSHKWHIGSIVVVGTSILLTAEGPEVQGPAIDLLEQVVAANEDYLDAAKLLRAAVREQQLRYLGQKAGK